MSRIPHPLLKAKVERFFNSLELHLGRLEGQAGAPARIYTDNSTEFVNVKYLAAFIEKAIELQYAIPRAGEDPDAR
jgi:hypothetical protein